MQCHLCTYLAHARFTPIRAAVKGASQHSPYSHLSLGTPSTSIISLATSTMSSNGTTASASFSSTSSSKSPPQSARAGSVGSKVKSPYTWREYTPAEIALHNSGEATWMIIHGKVYDVHAFMEDHPGGPEILTQHAGKDATADFEETFHSASAREQLKDYCIGGVAGYEGPDDAALGGKKGGRSSSSGSSNSAAGGQMSGGLNPIIIGGVLVLAVGIIYALYPHLTA